MTVTRIAILWSLELDLTSVSQHVTQRRHEVSSFPSLYFHEYAAVNSQKEQNEGLRFNRPGTALH